MKELVRYGCPQCYAVYDVWHEDGVANLPDTLCPDCLALTRYVSGVPIDAASTIWSGEEE